MRPAIVDPRPLREQHGEPGSVGQVGSDLAAIVRACDDYLESPRSRAATYWAFRDRTGRRSGAARRGRRLLLRLGAASAAVACGCVLLATFAYGWLRAAPLLPFAAKPSSYPESSQPSALVDTRGAANAASPGGRALRVAAGLEEAWTRIDVGEVGTIEASPNAVVDVERLEAELQIRIHGGILRAQIVRQDPFRPLIVVTSHLRVVVVGTRFDVFEDAARTRVEVFEGAVQVESPAAAVLLRAGESIDSGDPRFAPMPVPSASRSHAASSNPVTAPKRPRATIPAALSIAACEMAASPLLQQRCLERVAAGEDFDAQTATMQLASPAGDSPAEAAAAIERLRRYSNRFPRGVFATEAALREIELLDTLGRTEEVAAAGESFQRRFPSDSRAAEVAVARAAALCQLPGRRVEASHVLHALGEDASPDVRKAAHIVRSRCGLDSPGAAAALGRPSGAPRTSPPAE